MSDRWTHKVAVEHPVDPHYNGNGIPAWWSCHKCGGEVLLDGAKVPIVTPIKKASIKGEPPMSAQP